MFFETEGTQKHYCKQTIISIKRKVASFFKQHFFLKFMVLGKCFILTKIKLFYKRFPSLSAFYSSAFSKYTWVSKTIWQLIHIKHIFNNHCPYSGKLTTQQGLYIFIWFHATEKFFAFKTLLQTAKKYELYDLFVNNCNIVLIKKEYSKLITKKNMDRSRKATACLPFWYVFLQ